MGWQFSELVVGSKSVFGEFPTRGESKPLKTRSATFGREPAIARAVVVNSSAQAAANAAAIATALGKALEALGTAQGTTPFQSLYESLSPLEPQDDGSATNQNKAGGKGEAIEKPSKKGTTDGGVVSAFVTTQVLPESAPPVADASLGLPVAHSKAGANQEESAAPLSSGSELQGSNDTVSAFLPRDVSSTTSTSGASLLAQTARNQVANPFPNVSVTASQATTPASRYRSSSTSTPRVPAALVPVSSPQVELPGQASELPSSGAAAYGALSHSEERNKEQSPKDAVAATTSDVASQPKAAESSSPKQTTTQPVTTPAPALKAGEALSSSPVRRGSPVKPQIVRNTNPRPTPAAPKQEAATRNDAPSGATPQMAPPSPGPRPAADLEQEKQSDSSAKRSSTGDAAATLLNSSFSKVPFAARNENLAFTMQLQESKPGPARQQTASPAPPAPNQSTNNAKSDSRTSPPVIPAIPERQTAGPEILKRVASPPTQPGWMEAAVVTRASMATPESAPVPAPAESHAHSIAAAQDLQPLVTEAPKLPVSSDIQLHLTANDQSSASIRVTDRAGTVNISVHASDPQVRNSLRSNLSDLSTQLNTQGWKTEVVKAAPVMAPSDGGQHTPADSKHSSGQQQQSGNAERQPQRDRRANGGQWQEEFEEQLSGNDTNPGGKN